MECQALFCYLTPDFSHEDARGKLIQLIHDGYRQVNVLTSTGGTVRGNHYHKKCGEAFYILQGSVEVSLQKDDKMDDVLFATGDFFQIYPLVRHTMRFPEDCLMLQLYTECVESQNGDKDIFYE